MSLLTTARGASIVRASNIPVQLAGWPFADANAGFARIAGEQLSCRARPADLLHFFDLTGPALAPRRPFVTTIHDAAVQHRFERGRVAHKRLLQPWAVRNAVRAVAVSGFARDEAVRHFGADPDRVEVIHSGPGLGAGGAEATPQAGRYLLYVGNLSAHKNLPLLVEAFGRAGADDLRLVLVGGRGERYDEVERAVADSGAAARIEIRRDVGDAELNGLYQGAIALLLPSLYEGFGFTSLEAMARGCPVLASDIPALREVSGEGAMLVPPEDGDAWTRAIDRIVADEGLREDLRRRGGEQVKRYSWDETARRVCGLFLDAAG
jgi:glycosyltransferase involved in cell wall biosynthesis